MPIHVSASGRYFTHETGEPFFFLGDTLWEQFRLYSVEDARTMLEKRKEQGFTAIQIMLTGVGDGSLPNLYGETPWHHYNPATPNEAYFRHADTIMEIGRELGLILVIGVFHQLQRDVITLANAREYARFVAARYADAPHLIWSSYPKAEMTYFPILNELAAGLRDGDGGNHLITVHPDPSPTSSSFFPEAYWLDFHSIQTCVDYELVEPMTRADYERTPTKPVVMAEGGYEGNEFGKIQTPLEIRKQAFWTQFAGGWHAYGHNAHWTSPQDWRTWIESPGAYQMGVFKEIVTAVPAWWDGVPDQSVFVNGPGEGLTRNVVLRSAKRDWLLVYLSQNAPAELYPSVFASETVTAAWIDPRNGAKTAIGILSASGVARLTPPTDWEDAVLLLTV